MKRKLVVFAVLALIVWFLVPQPFDLVGYGVALAAGLAA